MTKSYFLVDSVLNPRIYPNHTFAASDTATYKSVSALSAARRIRVMPGTGWFANTLNSEAYFGASFDELRALNMLWIDRDHNLDGQTLSVRISNDGFTTYETVGPLTVPTTVLPGSKLTDGHIVRTNEGALLWWLEDRAGYDVRVYIGAMGSGLRPELAGAMIGFAWSPDYGPVKPVTRGEPVRLRDVTRTPSGQGTGTEFGSYMAETFTFKLSGLPEEDEARYHMDLYLRDGKPMVVIPDADRAETAYLSFAPAGGGGGFSYQDGWGWPQLVVPTEETEPVIR